MAEIRLVSAQSYRLEEIFPFLDGALQENQRTFPVVCCGIGTHVSSLKYSFLGGSSHKTSFSTRVASDSTAGTCETSSSVLNALVTGP